MRRLLIKEFREHRLYIFGALAFSIVLVLAGDPQVFWSGRAVGGWTMILWAAFVFMGLGSYSLEHSRGTMSFMLSRPVRWWWMLVAKLAVGLTPCLAVGTLGAAAYAVAGPRAYLPFLEPGNLLIGATKLAGLSAHGFLAGWAISCVVPGMAFSLLMGAVWSVVLSAVAMYSFQMAPSMYPALIPLAALLAANVLILRPPVVLDRGRRIRLWLTVNGAGFGVFYLVSLALGCVGIYSVTSNTSPDFRSTAYHYHLPEAFGVPGRDESPFERRNRRSRRPEELWVRVGEGPRVLVDRQFRIDRFVEWSDDSRSLVYFTWDGRRSQAKVASALSGWRAMTAYQFEGAFGRQQAFGTGFHSLWSPSGRKLAVGREGAAEEVRVIFLASGQCKAVFRGEFYFFRWVDDDHIEVQTGGPGERVIVPTAGD